MINHMIIILGIIYISFALFYLFYCWLDLRKQQRDYEEFKDRLDEEMERILKELDEKFHEEEDQE